LYLFAQFLEERFKWLIPLKMQAFDILAIPSGDAPGLKGHGFE